MKMQRRLCVAFAATCLSVVCLALLSSCGADKPVDTAAPVTADSDLLVGNIAGKTGPEAPAAVADTPAAEDRFENDDAQSAVLGASEIPYPVYPNGSKYRVGGENGLKIVVFETTDSFEQVDGFYRDAAQVTGMPRLVALNDYVRYSSSDVDKDPWATFRPGIVIHEFKDDDEREAVGADNDARTNIIMSF